MKNRIVLSFLALLLLFSCQKPSFGLEDPISYTSMQNFHEVNGVQSEFFIFFAESGGNFISSKGTKIHIKPNVFIDANSQLVKGEISLEFKDIYTKSDMLLSDMPTGNGYGNNLISAGEFFVRVKQNDQALGLSPGKFIEIEQPSRNTVDSLNLLQMTPFNFVDRGCFLWTPQPLDTIIQITTGYIYQMYHLGSPNSSGTWCNSDNPSFFANYPQTQLLIHINQDIKDYNTEVFLVVKNLNSMVHIYNYNNNDFPYHYAPKGLSCTAVAVGVKEGKLYYAMRDLTITDNLRIDFDLSPITTEEFKTKIEALN